MQDLILVGAGGCMRELVWQIQELNKQTPSWNLLGYVDYTAPEEADGVTVGNGKIAYLGTDDVLLAMKKKVNVAVCVGDSNLRKKIVEKYLKNPNIEFPNLILSDVHICEDVQMGHGCIVSMDSKISTNVVMGNFVFLNTGAKVCHDGKIDDFVTLSPDVTLAGNVSVGRGTELGMGAKVIQGIEIGSDVTIGAGAVVIRNISNGSIAIGVPAKKLK